MKKTLIPPQNLMDEVGEGDRTKFLEIGATYLQFFRELCDLQPTEKVLDVGCGVGRIAIPLTAYLEDNGSYEGFDVSAPGVIWCQNQITPLFPNFQFHRSDIYNLRYHPQGKFLASEYRFPYPDQNFDFVFLTSVFTHLLPPDLENYLSEIARVLKVGGRCLITVFLLNNESIDLMNRQLSRYQFIHRLNNLDICRVLNVEIPEEAIAYQEAFILNLYAKYGLTIKPPILYGKWCGRSDFFSGQDIIIAYK